MLLWLSSLSWLIYFLGFRLPLRCLGRSVLLLFMSGTRGAVGRDEAVLRYRQHFSGELEPSALQTGFQGPPTSLLSLAEAAKAAEKTLFRAPLLPASGTGEKSHHEHPAGQPTTLSLPVLKTFKQCLILSPSNAEKKVKSLRNDIYTEREKKMTHSPQPKGKFNGFCILDSSVG